MVAHYDSEGWAVAVEFSALAGILFSLMVMEYRYEHVFSDVQLHI